MRLAVERRLGSHVGLRALHGGAPCTIDLRIPGNKHIQRKERRRGHLLPNYPAIDQNNQRSPNHGGARFLRLVLGGHRGVVRLWVERRLSPPTWGRAGSKAEHQALQISEFPDIKDIQQKERRRGHLGCGRWDADWRDGPRNPPIQLRLSATRPQATRRSPEVSSRWLGSPPRSTGARQALGRRPVRRYRQRRSHDDRSPRVQAPPAIAHCRSASRISCSIVASVPTRARARSTAVRASCARYPAVVKASRASRSRIVSAPTWGRASTAARGSCAPCPAADSASRSRIVSTPTWGRPRSTAVRAFCT